MKKWKEEGKFIYGIAIVSGSLIGIITLIIVHGVHSVPKWDRHTI